LFFFHFVNPFGLVERVFLKISFVAPGREERGGAVPKFPDDCKVKSCITVVDEINLSGGKMCLEFLLSLGEKKGGLVGKILSQNEVRG
jgi:hypothetical protein